MKLLGVSRKQAFLVHLAASACIFFIVSYLIVFHWYPGFYFFLDGGVRGIGTIFFVDVVLGPGMTLLVFKPGKKTLKFDMTVILLLQCFALAWGIKSVYTERPATAVFYWGKISCISVNDAGEINMDAINSGPSGMQRLSFLQRPDSLDDRFNFTREAFNHQSSEIYYYGSRIVPLDRSNVARLDKYSLNIEDLRKNNAADAEAVGAYIKSGQYNSEVSKLIPLTCRYGNAIAVYDTRQLRISDTLNVKSAFRAEALDIPSLPNITEEIKKN
jgi:hypothetical protein